MDLVLTPLVVAGIASLAGKLADPASNIAINVVSSQVFDPLCRSLRGAAARRIREMDGSLPRNHDVERAVRTAQLDASRVLTAAFARKAERLNRPSNQLFARNALAWIERETKAVSRLEVDRALLDQLVAALNAPLVVDAHLDAAAARAAHAAFDELAAGVGEDAPDGFWRLWTSGGDTCPSWFAAFGDFLAEQTKTDDRFYRIVTAAGLAEAGAGVRRIEDVLAECEPVWTALRETTDQTIARLGRIEDKVDGVKDDTAEIRRMVSQMLAEAGDKTALLTEIEALRADNSLTARAIETFLRDVGETALTPDQWPGQLAVFADRHRQLLTELARRTNLPADLELERTRAAEAAKAGDLDTAEAILAALTKRLSAWRREQQEMLDQGARDEATLLGERAALAKARLRYQDAADLYAQAAAITPTHDTEDRWQWIMAQASVLDDLGSEFGDNDVLTRAIAIYRDQALPLAQREQVPLNWSATHNGLGNVLQILGGRESGIGRLEEAVAAYRAALEEYTRERVPLDWAMTQNNLGSALQALGGRESGTDRLEEAVVAYRAALEECTRERAPLDWAMTQNNLGNALQTLGRRESGAERLEEAVIAYRAAIEERTRERTPLGWASTQNNLGSALQILGEREGGAERLEEAVVVYRAVLEEYTRERVPLDWAIAQNNLGNVLQTLGGRESGTKRLEEAVIAYRSALEERTRQRIPLGWAMIQNNLGGALLAIGRRQNNAERLEEAAVAFQASLQEHTRESVPLDWAMTQNNLGNALQAIGAHEDGVERLEQAVAAYRAALEERTRQRVPLNWALTQNNLGTALAALGGREGGAERLEEAVAAYQAALEERTRQRVPLDWATTMENLALTFGRLFNETDDRTWLTRALAAARSALEVYEAANSEYDIETCTDLIARLEAELAD
ncbi:tetratricopeptide repeat protein [Caulobacter radicis]|uniref:Tetratricopeptide repeat protein n=1 Tax=Caulobacter radicis TaxID=2172650 RepID=A0A2T9JDN3_9CAUL|nr:tetratricopeptide repeat protein [Caulobacter radicis]PVM81007.1 hypothetical protein DDF65_13855 [Caulobacter radicis]